jgi:hypothetical protein
MREIKFKGKRIDNGEWVEGHYFITPLTDEATGSKPEDGWYFLTGRERHCISKNNCVYEIDDSTLCLVDDGVLLPEGFKCCMSADEKSLYVWHDNAKMRVIDAGQPQMFSPS